MTPPLTPESTRPGAQKQYKEPPWWRYYEPPRWVPKWLHLIVCTHCRGMRAYARKQRMWGSQPYCLSCKDTGVVDSDDCVCGGPALGDGHLPDCHISPCPNGCPVVSAS